MRKNINKIIAAAIGISVMSGSIIPAFAADATQNTSTTNVQAQGNQSHVLILDDAIKSAISISDTLALDEQKIAFQNKNTDITDAQDDFNKVNDDKKNYDDDTADAKLNQAKQQKDFDEDSLIQKVTDQYNSIVTSQMQINKAAKNLEVEMKKLEDAKLKQSLGIETSIDIESAELQIQKDQNDQTTNQNKLKDAEYTFKVLTGKDVTQYTLEQDVNFEPLKIDGSIDEYLDNVIDSYLKYSEQLVKLNKDYYDKNYEEDNKITTDDISNAEKDAESAQQDKAALTEPSNADISSTDPSAYQKYVDVLNNYKSYEDKLNGDNSKINKYTGLLASRLTYLTTKLNDYSSEVNISEEKKQFKDALKGDYTNLQTYEDSINYYKKEIELNNKQLSNYKLKYDLGMMTESDYNTQVINTEQAEIDLRNAIINYNKNKEYIQKPWIAFSSTK